ncbi:DegV family protein [Atopobacter phocae]|uniref:DegV family protein n=1 Tax=Atopobacter phocae TaxID=136492 RepID=UPI000472F275|nr:DegV family protein [Atopobacter phocae]
MKIALLTDSTAYLTKQQIDNWQVHVVSLSVLFGQEVFKETELDHAQFYQMLNTNPNFPTSSQPSPGEFLTTFEKLEQAGFEAVISVHLSSKISGTFQSVQTLSQQYEGPLKIYPIDSKSSCAGQGRVVQYVNELIQQQLPAEEIASRAQAFADDTQVYLMVDDLTNLSRGGRLSKSAAMVGNALKIKPLLKFDTGEIILKEKIRTENKVFKRLVELFEADYDSSASYAMTIVHFEREKEAQTLRLKFEEKFNGLTISEGTIGPVIGTHLGPGALGVTWVKLPADVTLSSY